MSFPAAAPQAARGGDRVPHRSSLAAPIEGVTAVPGRSQHGCRPGVMKAGPCSGPAGQSRVEPGSVGLRSHCPAPTGTPHGEGRPRAKAPARPVPRPAPERRLQGDLCPCPVLSPKRCFQGIPAGAPCSPQSASSRGFLLQQPDSDACGYGPRTSWSVE